MTTVQAVAQTHLSCYVQSGVQQRAAQNLHVCGHEVMLFSAKYMVGQLVSLLTSIHQRQMLVAGCCMSMACMVSQFGGQDYRCIRICIVQQQELCN